MSEIWAEGFEEWLTRMANQPLPGGVAAAAVAAAMGAALVAKVSRVALKRGTLSAADQATLKDLLAMAGAQYRELLRLAAADEQAYRAVLRAKGSPPSAPAWQQAWQRATEVPIQVAEVSGSLLVRLSTLRDVRWPSVQADLRAAAWLLEAGRRAALQAADSNLLGWGEGTEAGSLRMRIRALQEEKLDRGATVW